MTTFRGFVLYQDVWHQWRWALYSPNAVKIAESAVGYGSRAEAIRAAQELPAVARDALDNVTLADPRTWVV